MSPKIIQNESDYESACNRIYELIHSDIEKGTPEGNELEVLSLLVENYETKHHFIGYPKPIEAIQFRVEQMNLNWEDIAPLFGGIDTLQAVLTKKTSLDANMIYNLNYYLGIPLPSLINKHSHTKLPKRTEKKLLSNVSIARYFSSKKEIWITVT
ncbi:MAG: helix-turn-helix domain-containing protein [Chitinophagales bacterium]